MDYEMYFFLYEKGMFFLHVRQQWNKSIKKKKKKNAGDNVVNIS